ncbi:MAG: hypothetical protein K0U54_07065 [Bacteroidetes bacterium]|nr:hypothetical protein [Bacteroidota bacterium]
MKYAYLVLLVLSVYSCFPVKIAPNLSDGEVLPSKKFVKNLGSQYVYVFDDPKAANEFYEYINAKYQTTYDDLNGNTPVVIDEEIYYLTFYEVSKETKVVNLLTPMVEVVLEQNDLGSYTKEARVYREGKWYIALTVTDSQFHDALRPGYAKEKTVLRYVDGMRGEYLTTKEYIEVYLKGK